MEPQDQGVRFRVQVALRGQEIKPEEPIVAPAFADLEVRGELSNDVLRVGGGHGCSVITGTQTVGLVNHFDSVFVLGCPGKPSAEFQEHGEIVSSDNSVAIWIDFQSPRQAVDIERGRVDGVGFVLERAELVQGEGGAVIAGDDLGSEVWLDGRDIVGRGFPIDFHGQLEKIGRLGDELGPGPSIDVLVDLAQEVLDLLGLLGQGVLLAHQGQQFALQLGIQTGDHQLDGVPDFPYAFVLGRSHGLDVALDLLD